MLKAFDDVITKFLPWSMVWTELYASECVC